MMADSQGFKEQLERRIVKEKGDKKGLSKKSLKLKIG